MRKIFILIIFFISMIAMVYAAVQSNINKQGVNANKQQSDSISSEVNLSQPQAVTVTRGDEGFVPQAITISLGSTVAFVSKTDAPVWVASDDHPEHTDYPGFDFTAVKNRLPQPRDEFSITFNKTGTWGYHDHNAAEYSGSIIVK